MEKVQLCRGIPTFGDDCPEVLGQESHWYPDQSVSILILFYIKDPKVPKYFGHPAPAGWWVKTGSLDEELARREFLPCWFLSQPCNSMKQSVSFC